MSQAETTRQSPPQSETPPGDVLDKTIEATPRQGVTAKVAAMLAVPESAVFSLLRNVWGTSKGQPPLTNNEMFEGMSMIARFDLDPISREVYVTRDNKGNLLTMVAIDGWVKILDRTDHYDGHEVTIKFAEGREGELAAVISVTTVIHSKKRSYPTPYEAFTEEYAKLSGFMAGKIPLHMLRIFSLRHAARLFTPLGGSVMLPEEAEWIKRDSGQEMDDSHPSHEEQADAVQERREAQSAPAPEPTEKPADTPKPETTEDAVDVAMQMEECTGMIAIADSLSHVDEVRSLIEKDEVLNQSQVAALLEKCDARRKEIKDSRGSRSKK